jgi:hypothetical protein
MKNYLALSLNTETNEVEEVYVIAKNAKEAKLKVINFICICEIGKNKGIIF